ncbi:ribonuclease H-like domain-containing protein [Tanacetum coccineum]
MLKDHPLKNMRDRGIFDSGCSGHMTGNKDHLDDFEEFKGGSATFGELGHFNLFSISQICDKQHKVLFTKTECLVVTPDFKMPDENQILLKVPRQHNMYSFDMKTPGPAKRFACLIAKATSDVSKLWHRRLGHINFKNLNKLVKGNLARGLPSKVFRNDHTCVACHKGKQHRASWVPRPLLHAMLSVVAQSPGPEDQSVTQPQPSSSEVQPPPTSQPAPPTPIAATTTLVPQLITRIAGLEKELSHTKQTYGKAILTLVDRVKTLEVALKRKTKKVVVSDYEDEETEAQRRKLHDDPLVSLVQGFVTPSKTTVNASGEEQVEDISPTTLEAAAILTKVVIQKTKSVDKGKRYKRRKISKEIADTGLDFNAEVMSGFEEVNSGGIDISIGFNVHEEVNTSIEPVNTDSIRVSVSSLDRNRREGKAPIIEEEDSQASKRTKEQILQVEASLAEAIRLDALEKEEVAKQVHLDSLIAQRMAEEQELTEQQKKRKAQVQFETQSYTKEDWDIIRAKLEANAELKESVLGKDLTKEDFAKKMVELVNQRKKHFAEERARAKRNKLMTQAQLRNYMSNFLKNQRTWKLTQLKKLTFEDVKAEFEKLVKQVETFIPMTFKATKESLKRFGEELQTKTAKRLKIDAQPIEKSDEAKDDDSTKKIRKRRKQITRKGLHTKKKEEDESEEDEASEKVDPTSGTNVPIDPVLVDVKPLNITNYKIIKQGRKGVYQIVRENRTDKVYISFGAMLKDISRDDLIELYRIVMQKYRMNEPDDEYEKVFWGNLKTMFDAPLSTDAIWSLPEIDMLTERSYPLSAEVCKAMLDKKL